MDEMILVRKMDRRHVELCACIVGRLDLFRQYAFSAETCQRLLLAELERQTTCLLVAQDENKEVTGFAWFVPRGGLDRSGYLRLIAVDPEVAGLGVGQALLLELERRYLKPAGILVLASEGNAAAHRFYENMGYTQVGSIPEYVQPGLDERLYYKAPSFTRQGSNNDN